MTKLIISVICTIFINTVSAVSNVAAVAVPAAVIRAPRSSDLYRYNIFLYPVMTLCLFANEIIFASLHCPIIIHFISSHFGFSSVIIILPCSYNKKQDLFPLISLIIDSVPVFPFTVHIPILLA